MALGEATLSRLLLICPVALGACALLWILVAGSRDTDLEEAAQGAGVGAELTAGREASSGGQGGRVGARSGLGYAARLARIKRTLPPGYVVVASPPFIVVGDQQEWNLRHHVEKNIHWAGRHLKALFFEREPAGPLEIWLLGSPQSYVRASVALFGRAPTTPYGFYVAEQQTMVMNIQTGGGTLVHELVHAYMASNFSKCPVWLNEGLGSLYEMVGERKGRIWGFVNWRLPVLQNAIAEKRVVGLDRLLGMTTEQFYSGSTGLHYAEARYLLYYLQVQGLLVRFFRRARARWREDPTGRLALLEVLGTADLGRFQKRWEGFVQTLKVSYEVQVTVDDAQVRTLDPSRER